MDEKPSRRRWFRFSLRTMLVLVTLVCVVCGYLGWALNWKRQRNVVLMQLPLAEIGDISDAPLLLRLFGVDGVKYVLVSKSVLKQDLDRMRALFPEAEVQKSQFVHPPTIDTLTFDPVDPLMSSPGHWR
jgi:hypothetical protein